QGREEVNWHFLWMSGACCRIQGFSGRLTIAIQNGTRGTTTRTHRSVCVRCDTASRRLGRSGLFGVSRHAGLSRRGRGEGDLPARRGRGVFQLRLFPPATTRVSGSKTKPRAAGSGRVAYDSGGIAAIGGGGDIVRGRRVAADAAVLLWVRAGGTGEVLSRV